MDDKTRKLPPSLPPEPLIPKHGGYRNLKNFQVAQLAYDVTVRFCDRYIDPRSRTHDQMVQAARWGVQNIAEGSQVSGTSKRMELKLTNVARQPGGAAAGLRGFPAAAGLSAVGAQRPTTAGVGGASLYHSGSGGGVGQGSAWQNGPDRQITAQAAAFEEEGGFKERLYRVRQEKKWRK